ncbi:hypothetical protein [Ralstonia solanacearum]|nr:hypothetical protein [Ralstonia solanacearum]
MNDDATTQAVGMDCLAFCIRGMNQQLVDFASTDVFACEGFFTSDLSQAI